MENPAASDGDLLADWLGHRREPAFGALVSRYAGLVHAAARRVCGDEMLAAEASQLTFILLCRKAKSLTSRTSLAGWLHLTAVGQAKNLNRARRRESRKRDRLQAAMDTTPDARNFWREIQPVLDDALAALSASDREALLLRFYRSLTVREIGVTLGIAPAAAQKRIDRATKRLRGKLARRGIQAGGALSATLLAGFAADAEAAAPAMSLLASKAIAAGSGGSLGLAGFLALTAAAKKSTSLIIPAIALAAAALWTAPKWNLLATAQAGNANIRARIDAYQPTPPPRTVKISTADPNAPIDWQLLATEPQYGPEMTRFTAKLPPMSWPELTATLDKIVALDCPPERRTELEAAMAGVMGKQKPAWVLDRFSVRLPDGKFPLSNVFGSWLDLDFPSARAWYESAAAAGAFRGKSLSNPDEAQNPFEAALLFRLMSADPAAASQRLSGLPDKTLRSVMSELRGEMINRPAEDRKDPDFANLVRLAFASAERGKWFYDNGPYLQNADYHPQALAYLDRINATPAERADYLERFGGMIVNRTSQARPVSDEDMETIRAWFREVAPEDVDAMTGRALTYAMANRVTSMRFPQASAIALRLLEETGSDGTLATLLETTALDKGEQAPALALAARISDEARRAAIVAHLESLEFP